MNNDIIKRTQNANKLYNRVLEYESDLKKLFNSGFKLVNLKNLDEYFHIRTKLRCTYERLIVEESDFALANQFDSKLWVECYEKPVSWIENYKPGGSDNNLRLRSLRSLLINILDEGSSLFQLLLRVPNSKFAYNLSIYAAILLRKREHITNSNYNDNMSNVRSFNLLQDAITLDPFKGFGYLVMAQWTKQDGDNLLAMYWGLIACNITAVSSSENSLEFIKSLAREIVISPSFAFKDFESSDDLLNGQLLQMTSHAILTHLTGSSHLKHLDQLSHSQIHRKNCDLKSLKYNCTMLWIILGMMMKKKFKGESPKTANNSANSNVITPVQSCIIAKLFQMHAEFIDEESIFSIFSTFATNSNYLNLFTEQNYENLSKINNFAFESLNKLLQKILLAKYTVKRSRDELFMLDTFKQQELNDDIEEIGLVDFFLKNTNLFYNNEIDGVVTLRLFHEKNKKTERSMKLLTHRFLTTQLESLEATIEPVHLPWTVPDYANLLSQFSKIKRAVQGRQMKLLITLPLLQELDFDKNRRAECREIIRFLHEGVNASDPCIRLDNNTTTTSSTNNRNRFENLRDKFAHNHFESVKNFYENESKNLIIMCSDDQIEKYHELGIEINNED